MEVNIGTGQWPVGRGHKTSCWQLVAGIGQQRTMVQGRSSTKQSLQVESVDAMLINTSNFFWHNVSPAAILRMNSLQGRRKGRRKGNNFLFSRQIFVGRFPVQNHKTTYDRLSLTHFSSLGLRQPSDDIPAAVSGSCL